MPGPLGEELAALLPGATVVLDRDVLGAHATDRATFCPHGTPAALVRTACREDVVAVMEFAALKRVPVVPQGARSGVAGGANAVDGAILLDLTPMNRILDIDPVELTAKVEPGVLNAELSRAVAREGLYYPPDPSSTEFSTIGGNIATNAGGLCCVKYGVTADYVRGLSVVLADGRVLDTGTATAKGVAGYDLTRLFTGSEGTLGVITQATLSLRTQPPPPCVDGRRVLHLARLSLRRRRASRHRVEPAVDAGIPRQGIGRHRQKPQGTRVSRRRRGDASPSIRRPLRLGPRRPDDQSGRDRR